MKKLFYCLVVLPILATAQDCKNYIYMTNNAQVEMTVYDRKGKESGISTWRISDVKNTGNGFQSTINSTYKDEKGKEISAATGTYKCENGLLQADMRMALPQQPSTKDAEVDIDGAYLEYPAQPSVGQSLNDASFRMLIRPKSGIPSTVSFKEVNRKVEGQEKLTTPAGTWDAYVITYEATFRTEMAGIGIPMNFTGKEWFVPGVGVVKSETYRSGKLMGSTQVTSITK